MPLPQSLKDAKLWTLSNKDKLPLDPKSYHRTKPYGWSPTKGSPLLDYEGVKRHQRPGLLPALYVSSKNLPFLVVDVESEAMPHSKYNHLPYLYLEWSMNKGLHGILPLIGRPFEESVIVDEDHHTEFMLNRHFITFTEDEIELDQLQERRDYAYSQDFQQGLRNHLASFIQQTPLIDKPKTQDTLPEALKGYYYQAMTGMKSFNPPQDHQISHLEMQYYNALIYFFLDKNPNLSNEDLFALLKQTVASLMPDREKYHEQRNTRQFGQVTKQEYDLLKAISYVRNQLS